MKLKSFLRNTTNMLLVSVIIFFIIEYQQWFLPVLLEHAKISYYLICLCIDILFLRSPYNIPVQHATLLRALPEGQTRSQEEACWGNYWWVLIAYTVKSCRFSGHPWDRHLLSIIEQESTIPISTLFPGSLIFRPLGARGAGRWETLGARLYQFLVVKYYIHT